MAQRNLPSDVFGEAFAKLSYFDIYLYLGLVSIADGTGRGDASAKHLKHTIFSAKPRTAEKDIVSSLERLVEQGRVILNERMGVTCFYLPSWSQEQRVRGRSKVAEKSEKDVRGTAPHRAAHPLSPSSPLLPPTPPIITPISPIPVQECSKNNPNQGKTGAPALAEIDAFADEMGLCAVDTDKFYAHYSAIGWEYVRNWRAMLIEWDKRDEKIIADMVKADFEVFDRICGKRSEYGKD